LEHCRAGFSYWVYSTCNSHIPCRIVVVLAQGSTHSRHIFKELTPAFKDFIKYFLYLEKVPFLSSSCVIFLIPIYFSI
jgi:hypothetical protein